MTRKGLEKHRKSYQICNIVQYDSFDGGSVMGWGGISLEGRNRGNLTGARYRDGIFRPIARPYAGAVGPGFLLVHDDVRSHVARVCQRFLEDEGIDTILTGQHVLQTWTPSSTSETTWKNAFGCFQTHPGQSMSSPTPWLRPGRISILGQSVGLSKHARRCKACIEARGAHTRY